MDQKNANSELARRAGTYVLVLRVTAPAHLNIGRLGLVNLKPGYLLYVGSAFGPGGLAVRVAHHVRPDKRRHWHIDYLTCRFGVDEVWFSYDMQRREHQWAALLAELAGSSLPWPGFGASDCRCTAHLAAIANRPSYTEFSRAARRRISDHAAIGRCHIGAPTLNAGSARAITES